MRWWTAWGGVPAAVDEAAVWPRGMGSTADSDSANSVGGCRDVDGTVWPALGLGRLAQAPGCEMDDERRQAAREFPFYFTLFGPISPHDLLFFPADNE